MNAVLLLLAACGLAIVVALARAALDYDRERRAQDAGLELDRADFAADTALAEAGRRLGIPRFAGIGHGFAGAEGRVGPLSVSATVLASRAIRIRMRVPLPGTLHAISAESSAAERTGDAYVDEHLSLPTLDLDTRSRLDAKCRTLLAGLLGGQRGWVDAVAGAIEVDVAADADAIVRAVERARSLAEHLAAGAGSDATTRLAALALDDPESGVRRCCRLALMTSFPRHPDALRIAQGVLDAQDPPVQLAAARVLGRWDRVVRVAGSGVEPTDFEALQALREGPAGDAREGVDAYLRKSLTRSRLAAALPLAKRLGHDLRPALRERLRDGSEAQAALAAQALGETSWDADSESALVAALDDRDREVVDAAVAALERIGTPAAVEALHRVRGGMAKVAIAAIQERARGAVGQVSLAGADGRGALSEPERPPAQARKTTT